MPIWKTVGAQQALEDAFAAELKYLTFSILSISTILNPNNPFILNHQGGLKVKFSCEGLHSWPIQNFLSKQFQISDLRAENHRRWKPMFRIALLGHWLRNSHLDLLTELAYFQKYGFPNSICYCESIQKNNWLIAIGYGK